MAPQGLKPLIFGAHFGTAEAVPSHSAFARQLLVVDSQNELYGWMREDWSERRSGPAAELLVVLVSW